MRTMGWRRKYERHRETGLEWFWYFGRPMENLDESWPSGALSFSCEIDSCSSWATARNVLPHLDLTGVVFEAGFSWFFKASRFLTCFWNRFTWFKYSYSVMQGTCPKNRCRNCSPSSRKWCALWAFKKDFPARRMPFTSFCNSLHPFARSGAGLPVSTFLFSLPRQYVVGPADWRNYILWPLCAVEFWRWPWKQTLMFLLSVRRGFQILMPSFNSTMFCFVFSTWQGLSAYSRSNWQLWTICHAHPWMLWRHQEVNAGEGNQGPGGPRKGDQQ